MWNTVLVINQYKSCTFCTKAVPFIGDLARTSDTPSPYASMGLKTVPLLAPEYGEAAIQSDESLKTLSMV